MKAVVKTKRAKGMEFIKVAAPRIGLRDVLIKVTLASICGTDVHIYDWTHWARHRFTPPRIIGHEFVGDENNCKPRLKLPEKSEITRILEQQLSAFQKSITATPGTQHSHAIQTADMEIEITYEPDKEGFGINSVAYTYP